MAKTRSTRRAKPKDNGRRGKKKISPLNSDAIDYVDYKDVDLLRRFMSDRAKIRGSRVSGNDVQQQRVVARAIKNAREMGLLPYHSRVTTQRRGGGRNERGDRGDRGDRRPRDERPDDASPDVDENTVDVAASEAPVAETVAATEGEV